MQVLYIPSTVAKIGINLVYGTSTNTLSIYCNITWNQYLSIKGNSGWYANWYSLASGIAKVYFYSSTQPTTSDNSLIPTYLAGYWYGASTGTISVYA
jgi:hypothetical protein